MHDDAAFLSQDDVDDIFNGDPHRRRDAFYRAKCESMLSRAMAHFREASRRKEKHPRPTKEVLIVFEDGLRGRRRVPLHAAMAILLMPVDFGTVAKSLLIREEAIVVGFFQAGKVSGDVPLTVVVVVGGGSGRGNHDGLVVCGWLVDGCTLLYFVVKFCCLCCCCGGEGY